VFFRWLRGRWQDNVSYEGGLALAWMDGLVLIPFIMAAFFYPLEALLAAVAFLLVSFAVYESYVIWKKRHPAPASAPGADVTRPT
jgi:hypothetical protein